MEVEQQKLLDDLSKLEPEIEKAARDMATSQRSASGKLRDALGDMQKQELRLKMKWSLEVMKRGMGSYVMTRQPAVTQGLNDLRDRVREAQSALNREQPGGQDIEAALGRAEHLREQLEQLKNSARGQQKGQQAKPGQQSQQGQASGQQPGGQQPGQSQSATGQSGSAGPGGGSPDNVYAGGHFTSSGYEGRGIDPAVADRAIREGIRDLGQLEHILRGNNEIPREVSRDAQNLLRDMQQFDARLLGARPERINEIIDQFVAGVEQVELQLRRLADDKQSGSVRSSTSQPAPPGYAEAVAEYFRRLAKHK